MNMLSKIDAVRLRPLSALEKMVWYADQKHPNHFCVVGLIEGETRPHQWRDAIDSVIARAPLAWCRILTDANGSPELWSDVAGSVPLNVVSGATGEWEREVAAQMVQPFDTSRSPLVRATLLHEPGRATLILVAHHTIADGLSLTYLLRDILHALGGHPVARSSNTDAAEDLAQRRLGVFPPAELPELPSPVAYRSHDKTLPQIASACLDEHTTELLRQRSRAERTTVHCVLAASLVRAHSNLRPEERSPTRILSPIDLRKRLLGSTDHLGLCILGVVSQQTDRGSDLWKEARSFSIGFEPAKSVEGLTSIMAIVKALEARFTSVQQASDVLASAFGCDLLLSNLGLVDVPEIYGDLTLRSLWGPSVVMGFVDEQTVGVTTFMGRLHLLHTSYSPTQGLLQEALHLIREALRNESGSDARRDGATDPS